jgi:hypothetical protein
VRNKTKKIALTLGLLALLAMIGLVACKLAKRAQTGGPDASPLADSGPRVAAPLEVAETIYDQKLASGWDDWGWGPHELGKGPAKVKFTNYGGILFHHADLPWRYGGLAFRFKAPAAWGSFLHVTLRVAGKPDDAFGHPLTLYVSKRIGTSR